MHKKKFEKINIKKICVISILSALGTVLMLLSFPIAIVPSFIEFDISDLPALIASFMYGPISGITVCFIKNLLHYIFFTGTFGVGEISNFIIGSAFVLTAGVIYKIKKTKSSAILGSVLGSFVSALVCIPSNYFIIYPLFGQIGWTNEMILDLYQIVLPSVNNLLEGIFIFNFPFTFFKTLVTSIICILIYKKIKPILK